jgi:hypothetical protein
MRQDFALLLIGTRPPVLHSLRPSSRQRTGQALLRWHAHQEDRHGATTDRNDFVGRGSRLTSIKR